MKMGLGFGNAGPSCLALGLALWVGGCGAPNDDDVEDVDYLDDEVVDTARNAMAKSIATAGGKCHVKFGGYVLVGAGTYSSSGECCGMTKCTDDCDGKKYVEVCILCDAVVDVTCEDGHHPVARVLGGGLRSTYNSIKR